MDALKTASLYKTVCERRSIRKVGNEPAVDRKKIEDVVKMALHVPSAFNMQSGRIAVLLEKEHVDFWEMVVQALKEKAAPDRFEAAQSKIRGFQSGIGTLLFFEDEKTIQQLREKYITYKDQFTVWSHEGSGMLQYAAWLGLTANGFGASLHHYNLLIDEQVKAKWAFPSEWEMIAQMPFGWPAEEVDDRAFLPIEEVVRWV
ncbi:nitroreductase family protein [Bacillus chungangensis]|uniref:Oxidoreductase (Fatty acid repression mutant protein) n=1 Tax=Bacillus chungangensis TaxID=587633 RepID=A0ABT9WUB5_9BACI|nr:nitroreductase family protein [Bacillus chungangensis]MDQ0176776.1 putative oxidoreductase (fatty acid repression mutant protein) [Bacillus chungangensis]